MPRRLKDHEAVILLDDHQEYGLRAGDVGAIGTVYERHDAYDAESAKADRRPIAILTLDAAGIRPLSGDGLLHVRRIGSQEVRAGRAG